MRDFKILAFQNPEFKILADFKILAFQNPEFKLLAEYKTGEDFGAQGGSKSARMAKLWQFLQGHPKPAFSEKVQRGDQGKFFKNRPKRCPRLKGPKALWRKWRKWRKQRPQKGPNNQVMAILARSPKTRIF